MWKLNVTWAWFQDVLGSFPFFPGAFSAEANPGNLNVSNLCSLCVGQQGSFCEANSGELCYGEPGAFRCLTGFLRSKVVARADVAFLRHDTVLKMTVTQKQLDQAVSTLDRQELQNYAGNLVESCGSKRQKHTTIKHEQYGRL